MDTKALQRENEKLKSQVSKLKSEIEKLKAPKKKDPKKDFLKLPTESGEYVYVYKKAYEGIMRDKNIDIKNVTDHPTHIDIDYVTHSGCNGSMRLNKFKF